MGNLCPGGSVQGGSLSGRSPRGHTDTCEIITLPQTLFAGGKNINQQINKVLVTVHSHLGFVRVKHCVNYLLNNGLYCSKCVHSQLLFCLLLRGLKSSIMGCVAIFVIAWTEKLTQ